MFFTANVMILSAARAADEAKTLTAMATQARSLLIAILRSRVEEWRRYAEPRFQMLDCCHRACSVHESSSKGARKSKPIAAMTSPVATMSPSCTSRFDNGRAHASPPARESWDGRETSQYPYPRQAIVAAMKKG